MTKIEMVMFAVLFCGFITIQALNTDNGGSGNSMQEIPQWVS